MEEGDLELGEVDIIKESVRSLLDCVRNENNAINPFSPSIYMVPSALRDVSPSSFNPQVVSIGPLHKEDEDVQAFEKQKATYLMSLMSRFNSPPEEILELCMQKVYASMEKIKACYVWTKTYGDAEIAKMMVMDACFILEFTLQIWESHYHKSNLRKKVQIRTIIYDLVLLENQLPFFFLDEIYQCTIVKIGNDASLVEFIYPVLSRHNLFERYIKIDKVSINTTHHILSLVHECYKPHDSIIPTESLRSRIHSVVDLDRAGVNFEPNKDPTWLMGMEVKLHRFPCFFGSWSKPTLRMPVLCVDDSTEVLLRNLIAYEQSFETGNHITSYAVAMDMLVNSQEDVAKLIDSRVLVNDMGSNEEVANMINNLGKHVITYSFYSEQWETLNKYCNSYWPKHIARMRSTYFNSPWNMIALLVGTIIFSLTVVQTYFTVKSA
ncbi:hypothetical protein HanOQP8_Chr00c103g0755321 [Helianthus annuus]|nr:hypothetical protein HanOQP8_Chr00c103g0755321 [Helianthus annuus]